MLEKILVIILIIAAVVGLIWFIHRQRHAPCEGNPDAPTGCLDCPLRSSCTKPKKKS